MDFFSFPKLLTIGIYVLFGLVALIAFAFVKRLIQPDMDIVEEHWQEREPDFRFPPTHYYFLLREEIMARKVPHITFRDIRLHEGSSLFSPKRIYLRIKRRELVFDTCAAPFGTGYFFSWFIGRNVNPARKLLRLIPYVGRRIDDYLFPYTYYHQDTANMFQETIRDCVEVTIKKVLEHKGVRELQQPQELDEILKSA